MRTDVGVRSMVCTRIESNTTMKHEVVVGEAVFEFANGEAELIFTEGALKKFLVEAHAALEGIDRERDEAAIGTQLPGR